MGSTTKRNPNADAAGWPADDYSADLGHGTDLVDAGDTSDASRPLGHHEAPRLRDRLGKDADRITVLRTGTRLSQGSTYVDLERLAEGPFVALAGDVAEAGQLIVSKKDVDHELWNELVGRDTEPRVERPK
jgi:hypothetical protein